MYTMIKLKRLINTKVLMGFTMAITFSMFSCSDFELPEAGSIPDLTPPEAKFGAVVSPENNLTINFANLSTSATDYMWDFGDGNTSTDVDASNTYADIGQYTVTLTASDKLGATSTTSQIVVVEEQKAILPVIQEPGFEDGTLPDGSGDGRDSWRNDLGGVIQITSSPVYSGEQAAKFPSAGDRVGYQALTVSANTDYVVTYYYTMKEDGDGSMTVAILGGGITDLDQAEEATLVKKVGTDQADAGTYVKVDLFFNTGDNTTIAILMTNEGVESRVDEVSIALSE
ncbi:PKD domain-containing protein [Lutimonas zeaxanthinifaciens]|uniref:PKD domain-containing protein n=1 Tax=Lutimonas zeaxanthinifaciens TaxID=3060215 RepID=UPI00265D3902|nr:PKD domain-containing protein [Lutimonas sp. YSD2104]WKK66445.1 PKD domain-containing protein [Lutimonas sp. YSD2104]